MLSGILFSRLSGVLFSAKQPSRGSDGKGEREELFQKLQRQHNYSSLSRVRSYGTREFRPRARTVKSVNAFKIKTESVPE